MSFKSRLLPPIPLSEVDTTNPPLGRLILGDLDVDPPGVAQETELTRALSTVEPGHRVLHGQSAAVDEHLSWLAAEAGINQLRAGISVAVLTDEECTRLAAYTKRHGGRSASADCWAGLLPAAPAAVEQWLDACMRATSERTAWPPLPLWVSRQFQGSLTIYARLRDEDERRFDDDTLLFFDALIDGSAASTFDQAWRTFEKATKPAPMREAYEALQEAYRRFIPLKGALPIPKATDIRLQDVLSVIEDLLLRVTGRDTSHRNRPRDLAPRAFYAGICAMFTVENLGEPSPTDLTDLSIAADMISLGDGYDTFERITDRWKKRIIVFRREKTTAAG